MDAYDQERSTKFQAAMQLLEKRIGEGDTELVEVKKMLDSLRAFVTVNVVNLCFAQTQEELEIELDKVNLTGYLP